MARLHAAEKNDPGLALIGGEDRGKATVRALVRALVAGRARLVVVLGEPSVGGEVGGHRASQVGTGSFHRGLKGMHEIRTCRADDRYGSKQPRRQREVGG